MRIFMLVYFMVILALFGCFLCIRFSANFLTFGITKVPSDEVIVFKIFGGLLQKHVLNLSCFVPSENVGQ